MTLSIRVAIRFLLISVFIAMALHWYGDPILELLLPIYRWEINLIDAGYQVLSFSINNSEPEHVFSLQVNLVKPMFVGGRFIFPNPQGLAHASSIVDHVWQMAVLFFAIIFSWPASSMRLFVMRVLVGLPFLIGVLLLDIPFTLLAALKGLIVEQLELDTFSPLILWGSFLEGGGRLALSLVAGALVVLITNFLFNNRSITVANNAAS